MRLTPRDWRVLKQLDKNGRLTSGIIAHEQYLNAHHPDESNSISRLQDYGLVSKVGPDDFNSGLYEIELEGMTAVDVKDTYEDPDNDRTLEDLISEWMDDGQ